MRNGVNIRDLNGVEASTSQFPLIGYTVFWRLAGIRVSHLALAQALQAACFDKYLPDPPTPRVALRRALAEWIRAKQRIARSLQLRQDNEDQDGNSGGRRRTLIRVINRAGCEHLVYALVAEDIDFSELGLSYGRALRILLHKKNGEMICTTDSEGVIDAQRESRRVREELAPYWRQYRDLFISRDLSQMIREIIDGMNAVSLRQAGGVYFVPESERDSLFRLRQLIAGIPFGAGDLLFLGATRLGRSASVIEVVCARPSRTNFILTVLPIGVSKTSSVNCPSDFTGLPSNSIITSPLRKPDLAAGPSTLRSPTIAPAITSSDLGEFAGVGETDYRLAPG